MSQPNPKVDFYFDKPSPWQEAYRELRKIALRCDLAEELKWGNACYQFEGKNIVLIHGFKEYCAFLFFKGALLKDPQGILIQQTKTVQAPRQIRFTSTAQIKKLSKVLQTYILEAIAVEQAGLKVQLKKTSEFEVPEELRKAFKTDAKFDEAFHSLTPGRQRAYLLFFAAAKQAKTREARIEKYREKILSGRGMDD